MLWIEVDNYSFLGKHIPTRTPPLAASRVKSNDPRSVRQYHRLLRKQYRSEMVFKTYKKLKEEQELILANKTATSAERHIILSAFKKKFNSYHMKHHKLTQQLRKSVDKQMRQMFACGTEYSPEYQVLRDTIEFWSRILKLRKRINTSRITIKHMAKKLKLSWTIAIKSTLQTADYNLTQAFKAKPTAYKKRLEFQKGQIKSLTIPKPIQREFKIGLIDALTKEEVKLRTNPNPIKTRLEIEARIKLEQKSRVMGQAARNIR
jgi:hypothetical protein